MDIPTPSISTWDLFPALAVLVLVILCMTGIGLIIWREYRKWNSEQRLIEQKWQTEQSLVRDERWQNFMSAMQSVVTRENEQNRTQLADMAKSISQLSDNTVKMAEAVCMVSERVEMLADTLTGHIAVDDARFEVLLSDAQKAAIDDQVTAGTAVKPPGRPKKK